MNSLILALSVLFNPFTVQTPKYHLNVMHMGQTVDYASVDRAWEAAGGPEQQFMAITVTVMFARFANPTSECTRSVTYGITPANTYGGYMIVIDPRLPDDLRESYLSMAYSYALRMAPAQWKMGECND